MKPRDLAGILAQIGSIQQGLTPYLTITKLAARTVQLPLLPIQVRSIELAPARINRWKLQIIIVDPAATTNGASWELVTQPGPYFFGIGYGLSGTFGISTSFVFKDNPPCHKGPWYGQTLAAPGIGGPVSFTVLEWIAELRPEFT